MLPFAVFLGLTLLQGRLGPDSLYWVYLFKTLLGRRVTHGCIRLGDEDLEFVYRNTPIGSRVYLY